MAGYNTIPFRAGGSDIEAPLPPPASLTGSSTATATTTASTGYESDHAKARAKGDLSATLQWEVLGVEERLQAGFLKGLSVSSVDQHARQVTLEALQVSYPSFICSES